MTDTIVNTIRLPLSDEDAMKLAQVNKANTPVREPETATMECKSETSAD
jgi:hypothetical protein